MRPERGKVAPMRVMEVAKAGAYALGIVMEAESPESLANELEQATPILIRWKAKRGDRGRRIELAIMSPPADHTGIESVLSLIRADEDDLGALLRSLDVHVALLDMSGQPLRQYTIRQH